MKQVIALYSLYGKGVHVREVNEWVDEDKDWTRLTEPQEVTFIERNHADVVLEQVEGLNEKKEKLQADVAAKVAAIEENIQRLMAIEYSPTDET